MKGVTEITAKTTVAEFIGVADNAAITKLIESKDHDDFYKAIEFDKDLVARMSALQARTNNVLEPEMAINEIAAYLGEMKKKLAGATTTTAVAVSNDAFNFAKIARQPVQNEKRFVLSQIRTWGETKTPRGGGDAYKSVTVDGYYLIDGDEGVEIVSGQFVSNTALFKSFVKFDLSLETQTIDVSEKALAFMVRTEEHIAGVTTYPESRLEAISAATKEGFTKNVNSTTGVVSVLCYHKTNNKAVFRGLGAKINSVLSAKLEQMALELLDAKSKAQQDAQSKRVDNQLEIEKKAAETKNVQNLMTGLFETLSANSDKIQALGLDPQALMIAALQNK